MTVGGIEEGGPQITAGSPDDAAAAAAAAGGKTWITGRMTSTNGVHVSNKLLQGLCFVGSGVIWGQFPSKKASTRQDTVFMLYSFQLLFMFYFIFNSFTLN